MQFWELYELTHWGRVTHICVSKLTIIGSNNSLSPDQRQAIIWTNAGLLSIGPLWTYFSENLIKMQQFSLTKMHLKMSSAKWCPSCLGLNVLTFQFHHVYRIPIGGVQGYHLLPWLILPRSIILEISYKLTRSHWPLWMITKIYLKQLTLINKKFPKTMFDIE